MKLVGYKIRASLNENKNSWLWQKFMPRLKEIKYRSNENLLSVQIYNSQLKLEKFTPATLFDNWASAEVKDISNIPHGMSILIIPEGKYSVFTYYGMAKDALKFSRYIFEEWLPRSKYQLDERPHFQIMESDYNPNDPNAKETFMVPVK